MKRWYKITQQIKQEERHLQTYRTLRPRPHVSVFVWKRRFFFFRFGLPSTRIQWKRSTKTHLLKTFSETRTSRIRLDGRKQRFSKYMRWYHKLTYFNNTHALWGMLSSIILAFSYGRAKSILIRFVWTRIFFKTGLRAFSQFWHTHSSPQPVTEDQIWKNFLFNEEMMLKTQPATG